MTALPETVAPSCTASSTYSSGPDAVQTRGNRITEPGQIEGARRAARV